MKKILIITALAGSLSSCVSLEEDPKSLITSDQFYKTDEQAIAAVNAGYRKLYESGQSLYNSLFQIGVEMATDDYAAGPRARNAHVRAISGLTHDPLNDRMEQLWKQSYDAINVSNIAIDRIAVISSSEIDETLRARLINEAKFLRGLHYFNLVRWFGDVPIVLHETKVLNAETLFIEKASEEDVYQQIIQDLTDAEALPETYTHADVGRATSGAAKSILSKVYLTRQEWKKAVDKSKEVIDANTYQLFDNFADVFNVTSKNGQEHIFSAQFKGFFNYQGNSLASRSAPFEPPGVNGDYADMINKPGKLYESFSDSDERKAVTFVTEMISPSNGQLYTFEPHLHKYYDQSAVGSQGNSSKNLPIIRYAEVLLIYAEALNEDNNGPTAEAYWAIDEVRSRAGISKLADTDPALNASEFRDSVFQERRKELVFEYQRWFDLVRRGADYYVNTLKAAGKTNAAPRHIHFPTPQREINLNPKLTQHPDWTNY